MGRRVWTYIPHSQADLLFLPTGSLFLAVRLVRLPMRDLTLLATIVHLHAAGAAPVARSGAIPHPAGGAVALEDPAVDDVGGDRRERSRGCQAHSDASGRVLCESGALGAVVGVDVAELGGEEIVAVHVLDQGEDDLLGDRIVHAVHARCVGDVLDGRDHHEQGEQTKHAGERQGVLGGSEADGHGYQRHVLDQASFAHEHTERHAREAMAGAPPALRRKQVHFGVGVHEMDLPQPLAKRQDGVVVRRVAEGENHAFVNGKSSLEFALPAFRIDLVACSQARNVSDGFGGQELGIVELIVLGWELAER